MRNKERVSIYVDLLNEEVLHKLFINWFDTNFEHAEMKILATKRRIKKYWLENYDLRLSQVLVNMGYIENLPGFWYYQEDDISLINAGCNPRDILLWGQNYDADMNKIPKTKWILIKDMSKSHIEAVIAFMGEKLPQRYKDAFEEELKRKQ